MFIKAIVDSRGFFEQKIKGQIDKVKRSRYQRPLTIKTHRVVDFTEAVQAIKRDDEAGEFLRGYLEYLRHEKAMLDDETVMWAVGSLGYCCRDMEEEIRHVWRRVIAVVINSDQATKFFDVGKLCLLCGHAATLHRRKRSGYITKSPCSAADCKCRSLKAMK